MSRFDEAKAMYNTSKDEFYIAFPFDGHRPMCSTKPGKSRKIIVKIMA